MSFQPTITTTDSGPEKTLRISKGSQVLDYSVLNNRQKTFEANMSFVIPQSLIQALPKAGFIYAGSRR